MKNKIVICFLICLVSCSSRIQMENDIDLINKIFSAIKEHETQDLSFKSLTNFEWDRVCVFPPYTPVDSINKELGFKWDLSGKTNLQHDDINCLILFIQKKAVVKYLLHPRNKGDFSALTERCYPQDKAIYKVEEREDGGKVWYIVRNN